MKTWLVLECFSIVQLCTVLMARCRLELKRCFCRKMTPGISRLLPARCLVLLLEILPLEIGKCKTTLSKGTLQLLDLMAVCFMVSSPHLSVHLK